MKIDQSQITYIRLGESDTLERTQSAVRQWTDFIYNGAVNILGTRKSEPNTGKRAAAHAFSVYTPFCRASSKSNKSAAEGSKCLLPQEHSMEILPKIHQKNKRPWPETSPVPA